MKKLIKTQKCLTCKKDLPAISKYFNRSDQRKSGLYPWCKKCQAIRHQQSEYGLTSQQRGQIYTDQNSRCAICKQSFAYNKLNTDHNHKTGKVRGLLCIFCNTLVGYIEKCPDRIQKAERYLKDVPK